MTELAPKTIDEEFTRTKRYPNPMDFSEEQLARREHDIKDLHIKYPTLPEAWLEYVWNFCEKTPQEEHDRIIKGNLWNSPPLVERQRGGVLTNAIEITRASDNES